MSNQDCPLQRAIDHNAVIVRTEDLDCLKAAAKPRRGAKGAKGAARAGGGAGDDLLFYGINSELRSLLALAWTVDDQDPSLFKQQNDFKNAYANLRNTIASMNNNTLRMSVELPPEYIEAIEKNWLLDYAQKHQSGRREDWKKDEFFIRLMSLYSLVTGEQAKATNGGPCERFMIELVTIFRKYLQAAPDHSHDKYKLVIRLLGKVRDQGSFLKDWHDEKKKTLDIYGKVEFYKNNISMRYEGIVANEEARSGGIRHVEGVGRVLFDGG